jgi:hypothetical protein
MRVFIIAPVLFAMAAAETNVTTTSSNLRGSDVAVVAPAPTPASKCTLITPWNCVPGGGGWGGGGGGSPGGWGGGGSPGGWGGGGSPGGWGGGGGGYFPCDTIYNQRDCDMHASNHCHWHDGVNRCQNNRR